MANQRKGGTRRRLAFVRLLRQAAESTLSGRDHLSLKPGREVPVGYKLGSRLHLDGTKAVELYSFIHSLIKYIKSAYCVPDEIT